MTVSCPMPGDLQWDCTVIASGWIDDDSVAVLALRIEPPYYQIYEIDADGPLVVGTFRNIVPAARAFDETYGFWGGS